MGVSGSGKSTVAEAMADAWDLEFRDGDEFHSDANKQKMQRGEGLNDDDRRPWLDAIGEWLAQGPRRVVAASALRRAHRNRLRAAVPGVRFVFLDVAEDVAHERVAQRRGHFMPASLVRSQFETLERPASDESDVVWVTSA